MIQTPIRKGAAMKSWLTMKVMALGSPPFSCASACVIAMVAQPCWDCHHRSGMVNATARSARTGKYRLARSERPAAEQDADDEGQREEPDRVLVRQPEAENDAGQHPQAHVAAAADPEHDQGQRRPGQQVEARRAQRVVGGENNW